MPFFVSKAWITIEILSDRILGESGPIVMSNGKIWLTIPHHNLIIWEAIAKEAGLSPENLREVF